MDGPRPVVPVLDHLVEILDFVLAQGCITLDGEPRCGVDTGLQLNAHAVRVLDVRGQVLADVAHGSSLHELVGVVHIIKVHACAKEVIVEGVAHLIVEDRLSRRSRIGTVVRKVVALGLAMAHGYRGIGTVATSMPRQTGLRVQEVVLLVDVEALVVVAASLLVEFVVDAVGLVAHVAVLDVGEGVPLVGELVGCLHKDVAVELLCTRTVVFVCRTNKIAQALVGGIGDIAKVVTPELLYRHATDDVPFLVSIVDVAHQSGNVLP